VLVTAIALVLVVPGAVSPAASGATSGQRSAEAEVLRLINVRRAQQHLAPIRMDLRVRSVAEARSADMVARHYFAHQDPDGKLPWDHLTAARIVWYGAGEIIAMNTAQPLSASAARAVEQWMDSPPHREQVLSATFNYAGVGVALDGAASYWTVVFIEGPDRTAAVASVSGVSRAPYHHVRVTWRGSDPRLVTHTAGLATFDLARRVAGGSWTTLRWRTTRTALTLDGRAGVRYQFRVRARDRNGNVGAWSAPRAITAA
jgi:uncharacterized protein YkwD